MGKIPESEKSAAILWFAKLPRVTQLEVITEQTRLLREARLPGVKETSEILLDKLAHAARRIRHEEESLKLKERLSSNQAKDIHERRISRFKASRVNNKPSPKREEIRLKYFHLIQELRVKENFGWRNCAVYLREYHKFNVTHAYLRNVIEDLESLENGN